MSIVDFYVQVIEEMYQEDQIEQLTNLYERFFDADGKERKDHHSLVTDWIEEMMDLSNIPEGGYRTYHLRDFYHSPDLTDEILVCVKSNYNEQERHIAECAKQHCFQDDD